MDACPWMQKTFFFERDEKQNLKPAMPLRVPFREKISSSQLQPITSLCQMLTILI